MSGAGWRARDLNRPTQRHPFFGGGLVQHLGGYVTGLQSDRFKDDNGDNLK